MGGASSGVPPSTAESWRFKRPRPNGARPRARARPLTLGGASGRHERMAYSVRDALAKLDRLADHPEVLEGADVGEVQGLRDGFNAAAILYDTADATREELLGGCPRIDYFQKVLFVNY